MSEEGREGGMEVGKKEASKQVMESCIQNKVLQVAVYTVTSAFQQSY